VNEWTVEGRGNFWSDYAGYDADGDGFGDIAYRSERLFENLMQKEPNLRLFMYSPVVNALDFGARALPIVKPQPKLIDERPLMAPVFPDATPPLPQPQNRPYWMVTSTLLIVIALWLIGSVPRWQRRYFDNSLVVMKR
jgi:nitrous oxidase accessory protein